MHFLLSLSRQGKTRVSAFFSPTLQKERQQIIRQVFQIVSNRSPKASNIIEWKNGKLVYKRYASLYFVAYINKNENELLTLAIIHHYVELLDKYFSNVCELDLIFSFHQAHHALDELLLAGEIQESSIQIIQRVLSSQDLLLQEQTDLYMKKSKNIF